MNALAAIEIVDQFSDPEEDDRVERSHNPHNHERFYMKDRLSENGFFELFGFSKSEFETIMTFFFLSKSNLLKADNHQTSKFAIFFFMKNRLRQYQQIIVIIS